MEGYAAPGNSRDILAKPWLAFGFFWLPGIAIAVTATPNFSNGQRTVVWTAALGIMGMACLANAARCGRTHCYLTGPFFLLMALASIAYGLELLRLGRNGWGFLGLTILIGGIALCFLPELLLGKYRKGKTPTPS